MCLSSSSLTTQGTCFPGSRRRTSSFPPDHHGLHGVCPCVRHGIQEKRGRSCCGAQNFTQMHGDSDAAPTLTLYNLSFSPFPPLLSPFIPHTPVPFVSSLLPFAFLPENVASTWLASKARGIQELQDYPAVHAA